MSAPRWSHRSTALGALLLLAGCVATTGGERVRFDAEVASSLSPIAHDGQAVLTWEDHTGRWTLTQAQVYVGPVYLWSDEPLLDPGALGRLQRWAKPLADALIPAAHAQAVDQFEAGFLRGELTAQIAVDLLSEGPWPLGTGEGIAGRVRSGELWLEPVPRDHTLRLAGHLEPAVEAHDPADTDAPRSDTDAQPSLGPSIPFSVALTITPEWVPGADEAKPSILRRVRGLLLDGQLTEGARLRVTIDPSRWLQGIGEDDLLDAPLDEGAHQLTPDTRAGLRIAALLRRTGTRSGWTLDLQPGDP